MDKTLQAKSFLARYRKIEEGPRQAGFALFALLNR
jgi:hypothetical protein